ncbi:hypothetical protein SK571_00545 [Lentzea sp. BCCO 10_0798]|uniref:Uncharacterized protein n=1 Tax=Lentzea kristufekii TaxID=3095430 RepID=A0ABU4THV8_9PSEU|nr:hypothetical protein [Lentzea sp. BCCO 10_0798]MDX8047855.1 hypothetical protein [Lentzea sp. BCCO 10_0798]
MFDLVSTQELVEREVTDARKQVTRYQHRIDNAEALAREEQTQTYGPQIESLRADVEAVRDERDRALTRIEKLAVAMDVGVPLKNAFTFGDLLQGTNPDEYRDHAHKLLTLFERISK